MNYFTRKIILGTLSIAMNDTILLKSTKIALMSAFDEALKNTPTEESEKAYDEFFNKYIN